MYSERSNKKTIVYREAGKVNDINIGNKYFRLL